MRRGQVGLPNQNNAEGSKDGVPHGEIFARTRKWRQQKRKLAESDSTTCAFAFPHGESDRTGRSDAYWLERHHYLVPLMSPSASCRQSQSPVGSNPMDTGGSVP